MRLSNLFRRRKPAPREKSWVYTDQGMMDTNWDAGWWQQDLKPLDLSGNEAVEACVSALSQTVAMCPIHLWEEQPDGQRERRYGANAERVLKRPNNYQTRSQFFNMLIRSVYFHGNGYAVAMRDDRRAVSELHLLDPRNTKGVIDPETGDVFYWVSPKPGRLEFVEGEDRIYPSRDILNVRINTNYSDPLKGHTPVTVAANAIAANNAITGHQASFFNNMSRPSGALSTDLKLTQEQMTQLRQAWEKQSKGMNSGRIPILSNGLKWEQMSISSQDAQLVEAFQMTVISISRVFRVPPPVLNDLSGMTYANTEQLMSWFLSSGLGFLLEHIELELNNLFDLNFNQYLNFETRSLLRSDWKSQIETLGAGVQNGIYAPNEARAHLGLRAVDAGDEPRVQQQVVPLSAWDMAEPAPAPAADDVAAALVSGIEKGLAANG